MDSTAATDILCWGKECQEDFEVTQYFIEEEMDEVTAAVAGPAIAAAAVTGNEDCRFGDQQLDLEWWFLQYQLTSLHGMGMKYASL